MDPDKRDKIRARAEEGRVCSADDIIELCDDADIGDRAVDAIEAVEEALNREGLVLLDVETDDDDGPVFKIELLL